MIYNNIVEGTFISRPNRFIAQVMINENIETVHVKNTGRCKELLIEGAKVYLEKSNNPNRKTKFDLISVYKNHTLINMDSQIPNYVVKEALECGKIKELGSVDYIKSEVKFEDSRYDIYYEKGDKKGFIEVKGVTLENNTVAMFPDAPTSRGQKHINGLIQAKKQGYEASIVFLIQIENVTLFKPNIFTDPDFSAALKNAHLNGVNILVYNSVITKDSIVLKQSIPYEI